MFDPTIDCIWFCNIKTKEKCSSGGELLELRLLDTHLLDTFGSKTIARHEIDKLLESSKADSNRRGKYCKLLESGFN